MVVAVAELGRDRAIDPTVADGEHGGVVLGSRLSGKVAHCVLAVLSCIESDLVSSVHWRD